MDLLRLPIIASVALLFSAPLLSAEEIQPRLVNPALIYWQAISLMGELSSTESRVLSELLSHPAVFDDATAASLLSTRESALKRFEKATASTVDCDWGLSYEDGPSLPLPHVSKIQVLCRLGLLKAERLFARHKTAEAIDWLLRVHRAARHCGAGDLVIPVLAQFQIDQSAMKTAAAHILDWNESTRLEYMSKWESLPPLHTVKNAIKGELLYIDWLENFWLQHDETTIKPDIRAVIMHGENAATMTDEERAAAEKLVTQCTPENIKKWTREIREFYIKMQSAMDKPWLESNSELVALQSLEEHYADNLMMRLVTPLPLHKVNDLSFKTATYHTMLKAALEHGTHLDETIIATYTDSFAGAPLILKRAADNSLMVTVSPTSFTGAGRKIELSLGMPKSK